MTFKQRIEKELSKNPNLTKRQIAIKIGSTTGYVKKCISELRSKGVLPEYQQVERKVVESKEPDLKDKIKALFKKKDSHTPESISDALDIGISKVVKVIEELRKGGYNFKIMEGQIHLSKLIPKADPIALNVKKMTTGMYKFGLTGDNHLCSKYERMDVLNALYDEYVRQGITVVYNTGNWIDGEARFNKNDIHTHGMKNQVDYFVKHYPQRKGITTYFIAGDDHEGWYTQREGIEIGKYAEMLAREAGRKDLVYMGYMEADVVLPAKKGKTTIRIMHPGGGSSYAVSYTTQKIVESFTGGDKPDVLANGHYHKAEYLFCRGVHCIQTACTCDQTPFMRKKRLAAHVGGWTIEFGTDDRGAITRFRQEYIPFYDNAYYKKWQYK